MEWLRRVFSIGGKDDHAEDIMSGDQAGDKISARKLLGIQHYFDENQLKDMSMTAVAIIETSGFCDTNQEITILCVHSQYSRPFLAKLIDYKSITSGPCEYYKTITIAQLAPNAVIEINFKNLDDTAFILDQTKFQFSCLYSKSTTVDFKGKNMNQIMQNHSTVDGLISEPKEFIEYVIKISRTHFPNKPTVQDVLDSFNKFPIPVFAHQSSVTTKSARNIAQ